MQTINSPVQGEVILPENSAPAPYKVGNFQNGQARMEVSNQWLRRPRDQRFTSLSELAASVQTRMENSIEARIVTKELEVQTPEIRTIEDTHKIHIAGPEGDLQFTNWSFGQLAGLAGAPAGYLRKLPTPIVADALNYGLRYNRSNEAVKLYATNQELRAATGPDYGRIFDVEIVKAVQQIAGNGTGEMRWKIPGTLDWRTMVYDSETPVTKDTTTLFASDRDVFIFLVDDRNPIQVGTLPDGGPDLMFRGFYVQNSEVGSAALKIAAFYLRAVCCNRILWGVERFEELTMRHSKYAPSRFVEEARPALEQLANGSTKSLIEGVQAAKQAIVAKDEDNLIEFLNNRGFARKQAVEISEIHEREEGFKPRSAWDVANGITAFARSIENQDERVAVEIQARKILDKVA